MSWRERLTAKLMLFALLVYFPSQVLGGIENIRSQYGLSGLLPQNETIIGEISQPGVQATSYSKSDKETIDSLMKDDLDYVYYDEPTGESLFSPVKKIEEQPVVKKRSLALRRYATHSKTLGVAIPKPILSPSSAGKCFVEVLTSSLVKPKSKVPLGNGSNPSLSVIETCCSGYEAYVHDKELCVPVCDKPCVNGFCVKSNVCECFPDHVRSLNDECIPTCPIGCLNGHCYINGTCSCKKGYVLDPFNSFCMPYCSQPCGQFGNCSAPETCTCIYGYRFNARKCLPYCPKGCQHGNCVAPDECSCNKGYHKVNGMCKPHCPRGCLNGKCTAPNRCRCNYGYEKGFFGTLCKEIKRDDDEYESKPKTIYNPAIVAVPTPKSPKYHPPIHVDRQPYPRETYFPPPVQNPPIYNPPISAQPAQVKPMFNVPLEAKPSVPAPSSVGQGSIYAKQPAYNPFYQAANQTAFSSSKSNYLERQPAFNPNFKADVSLPKTTIKPTTHKPTSFKSKLMSIFSFDFWGSKSKDSSKPSCSKKCSNGKCTGRNQCTCNFGYKKKRGKCVKR